MGYSGPGPETKPGPGPETRPAPGPETRPGPGPRPDPGAERRGVRVVFPSYSYFYCHFFNRCRDVSAHVNLAFSEVAFRNFPPYFK